MTRTILASSIIALALFVAACGMFNPMGHDPQTGDQLTLPELEAAKERAREDALAEQRAADAAAERELARLRRDAEIRLRRLDLTQQSEVIGLEADLDAQVSEMLDLAAKAQADREGKITRLLGRYDQEIGAVRRRQDALSQILPIAEQVASTAGVPTFGLLPILATLFGIGGTAAAVAKAGQARRAEERTAGVEAAAESVIDSIDVLKRVNPGVAEAFKQHKATLDEWQGPAGKALVERLQAAS